jgi:nitrogen regulatory protein PII-like uncharacterized protein
VTGLSGANWKRFRKKERAEEAVVTIEDLGPAGKELNGS